MNDDIVTRLRAQTTGCDDYNCESCEIETEAADEIERLREQNVANEEVLRKLGVRSVRIMRNG